MDSVQCESGYVINYLSYVAAIIGALGNATQCAPKWGKAWHSWALFNTAVMSHYTLRGYASTAGQFVVAAVTGYFHSIACAANSKGVDDSLQVKSSGHKLNIITSRIRVLHLFDILGNRFLMH